VLVIVLEAGMLVLLLIPEPRVLVSIPDWKCSNLRESQANCLFDASPLSDATVEWRVPIASCLDHSLNGVLIKD